AARRAPRRGPRTGADVADPADAPPPRTGRAAAAARTRKRKMPSSTSRSPERTPTPGNRFTLPGRRPRRIAHRGLALHSTENTLSAFAQALEAGATMLETDTRATSDGLALAVHDETLERIAQDPRRIDALTASEAGAVRLRGEEPLAMLE